MIYIIPVALPALGVNSKAEFSQLSAGGRLEIDAEDFFWRINELLLALG